MAGFPGRFYRVSQTFTIINDYLMFFIIFPKNILLNKTNKKNLLESIIPFPEYLDFKEFLAVKANLI